MPRNIRTVRLTTEVRRSFDDSFVTRRVYLVPIPKGRTGRRAIGAPAWYGRYAVEPATHGLTSPRRRIGKPLLQNGGKP